MVDSRARNGDVARQLALCVDDQCVGREGDGDADARRAAAAASSSTGSAAHGRTLDEVDVLRSSPAPDRSRDFASASRPFRVSRSPDNGASCAVPTLEAMAAARLTAGTAVPRVIVPCLDGQRGEVFAAAVDTTGAAAIDDCRVVLEPRAGRPEEIAAVLASLAPAPTSCSSAAAAAGTPASSTVSCPASAWRTFPNRSRSRPRGWRRGASSRAVSPARAPSDLSAPSGCRARARPRHAPARDGASGRRLGAGVATSADLAAVEALQRRAFTNPWGAEAIRWELENTDVARLYVMRDAVRHRRRLLRVLEGVRRAAHQQPRRGRVAQAARTRAPAAPARDRRRRASGARSATLEVRQSNKRRARCTRDWAFASKASGATITRTRAKTRYPLA